MSPEGSDLFCWGDLRSLWRGRWTFGSHAVSHTLLADLTSEERSKEWGEGQVIQEAQLDREIWVAAHPKREARQIQENGVSSVEKSALRAACPPIPGIVRSEDSVMRLPRLGLSARDDLFLKLSGSLDCPLWKPSLGGNSG
ncbi:MAG: hypothetical protein QF645_09445 [Planctomycetota bacterium]|nr:hypothetical protein [Planctomycetota bacterium]